MFCENAIPENFRKIHRKIPAPECLVDIQLYLKEAPAIVLSKGFREILGTNNHGQNILDKL